MNFKKLHIPLQAKIAWRVKGCLVKTLQVFGHVCNTSSVYVGL